MGRVKLDLAFACPLLTCHLSPSRPRVGLSKTILPHLKSEACGIFPKCLWILTCGTEPLCISCTYDVALGVDVLLWLWFDPWSYLSAMPTLFVHTHSLVGQVCSSAWLSGYCFPHSVNNAASKFHLERERLSLWMQRGMRGISLACLLQTKVDDLYLRCPFIFPGAPHVIL